MYSLATDSVLRIVQITDTHLHGPEDGHLLGMKTLHSLQCVLDIVAQQRPAIDAFVVSGDLSQDGSLLSYQRLHNALANFQCPNFWLEGNHDVPELMQQAAANTEHLNRIIRSQHWQIILLNSQVMGSVFGHLADDQLQLLDQALAERPELHSLVCLHHHPIPIESRWMDNIGLQNPDEFFAVLNKHNNVRAVLCGHVHQESDRLLNGLRFLSSPSTCVQFSRFSDDFDVDTLAPGYRWLDLHADGLIETGVSRVEGVTFEIDYSVKGY